MPDNIKGLIKRIESGCIVPLTISRNSRMLQWDFEHILTDDKGAGAFPQVVQIKEKNKLNAVCFRSLNKFNIEQLNKSISSADTKIPRYSIKCLQKKIEEIHQLAEDSNIPNECRDFLKNFSLPDPTILPDAWRITGTWKKKLHILWGYSSGDVNSTFLPQSRVSQKWSDSQRRYDVSKKCNGKLGGAFFPRLYHLIFWPILLVALLLIFQNRLLQTCTECNQNRMLYGSGNICTECRERLYCKIHKEKKINPTDGLCDLRCKRCLQHPDSTGDYCTKHYCSEHEVLKEQINGKEVCPHKCKICQTHGVFPNNICTVHNCKTHGNKSIDSKGACTVSCKRCSQHPDSTGDYCTKHYCSEHKVLKEQIDGKEVCPHKCKICQTHGVFPNNICTAHNCEIHGNKSIDSNGMCTVSCNRCGKHPDGSIDKEGKLYNVNGQSICAAHYCFMHKKWMNEQNICPVKCKKCDSHPSDKELQLCQKHEKNHKSKLSGIAAYNEKRFVDALEDLLRGDLEDSEVQYYIGLVAYDVEKSDDVSKINEKLRAISSNPAEGKKYKEELLAWAIEWLEKSVAQGDSRGKILLNILKKEGSTAIKKRQ